MVNKNFFYNNSFKYFDILKNQRAEYFWEFINFVKYYLKGNYIKILDLGCGTGQSSYLLSKAGYQVTGLDYSQKFISYARENFPEINFVKADVEITPFADNFFDAIVSYNTIEHFNNLEKSLKEMKRILKKNGLIVLQSPNLLSPKYPINAFLKNGMTYEGKKNFFGLFIIFLRNLSWLIKKRIYKNSQLIFRTPNFDYNFPDCDATSFICPFDVKILLEKIGIEIISYQNVDHLAQNAILKKMGSRLLPDFMGIIRIVSKKAK